LETDDWSPACSLDTAIEKCLLNTPVDSLAGRLSRQTRNQQTVALLLRVRKHRVRFPSRRLPESDDSFHATAAIFRNLDTSPLHQLPARRL
jgi:hypothetical protein